MALFTAPDTVPTMSVSLTQGVVLSLNKPSNINGELRYTFYAPKTMYNIYLFPHSHYQLVAVYLPTLRVPAQSPDVAFPETNLLTYQEVHIKSRAVAYDSAMMRTSLSDSSDYPNNGQFYTFFLRAFPKQSSTQKRQAVSSH